MDQLGITYPPRSVVPMTTQYEFSSPWNVSSTSHTQHKLIYWHFLFPEPARKDRRLTGEINNISSILPSAPVLSQFKDIPVEELCPLTPEGAPYCNRKNCHCFHLRRVSLGTVVQIVLHDQCKLPCIVSPSTVSVQNHTLVTLTKKIIFCGWDFKYCNISTLIFRNL
jgi:hypothetical protein